MLKTVSGKEKKEILIWQLPVYGKIYHRKHEFQSSPNSENGNVATRGLYKARCSLIRKI